MIFVIDSTNTERLSEAHDELAKLLAEKRLEDALILIYANKQVGVLFFLMSISLILTNVEIADIEHVLENA